MPYSREKKLSFFFDMLRIRKVQLRIESLYHLDEIKTPVHLCIGQEAIPVGVCANLKINDYISSNHRGHGHYLAKGGDLKRMIAELYCKETGCSKGRGGSMHLVDPAVGHMGSSSIVGGGIPIGTGLALSIKMKIENRVSVIFFGDGAADEGVLYESVNFAILKKLPVIFVFENNQFSVCSHVSTRQKSKSIFHSIPCALMYTARVDGNSVLDIYETTRLAVNRARRGDGPSFIECMTYRIRGHGDVGSDAHLGYRPPEEIAAWEAKCPIATFRNILLKKELASDFDFVDIDKKIDDEIDEAFRFAQKSPLPKGKHILQYLYSE